MKPNSVVILLSLLPLWLCGASRGDIQTDTNLRITASPTSVPLGKAVTVTAAAKRLGQPVVGQEL